MSEDKSSEMPKEASPEDEEPIEDKEPPLEPACKYNASRLGIKPLS